MHKWLWCGISEIKMYMYFKRIHFPRILLFFIISAMLLLLSTCDTINSKIISKEAINEKNSTVKVDDSSSKDIVIVENMYPISDIETLDKFNQLLPLEETTQELPSYEEIPIYNNFYIVPDIIHDDRILMEKILNKEVILLINPTYGQMVEK